MDNGSKTEAPVALTYSIVVSRDSVQIEILISELNELGVMAHEIGNSYLNEPCKEKIWFKAGSECTEHQGKFIILVRALYGIKMSGASWWSMFKKFIEKNLHFK